jgi:hypothetical protein
MHWFACVSIVFPLCSRCRNMSFWCIPHVYKNVNVPYFIPECTCFYASVLMCFCSGVGAETTIFSMYERIHICHTLYIKCTILLVFLCVSTAEKCIFCLFYSWYSMYHKLNIKCTVLPVFFMCLHCVLLQKLVIFVHFTFIQEYTCTIIYTWTVLFC